MASNANLFSIISDIRKASGLGGRPMLAELADSIGTRLNTAEAEARAMREALEKCAHILPRYCMAGKNTGEDEECAAVLETVLEALGGSNAG